MQFPLCCAKKLNLASLEVLQGQLAPSSQPALSLLHQEVMMVDDQQMVIIPHYIIIILH